MIAVLLRRQIIKYRLSELLSFSYARIKPRKIFFGTSILFEETRDRSTENLLSFLSLLGTLALFYM